MASIHAPHEGSGWEKREDAPDAAGTSSQNNTIQSNAILSSSEADVNPCLRLKEVLGHTGAMNKEVAEIVRKQFGGFTRQLLTQCSSWEKYGVIIHPDGLRAICKAYNYNVPTLPEPTSTSSPTAKPAKSLTQCDRILRHFQDYGSITSLEAMKEYGIMRLSARISDLRRLGYAIRKTMETSKNRYGEPTSYARYSMEDDNHGTDA